MSLWDSSCDPDRLWILCLLPIFVTHSAPLIFNPSPMSSGGFASLLGPVRCSHLRPDEFPQAGGLVVADSI